MSTPMPCPPSQPKSVKSHLRLKVMHGAFFCNSPLQYKIFHKSHKGQKEKNPHIDQVLIQVPELHFITESGKSVDLETFSISSRDQSDKF